MGLLRYKLKEAITKQLKWQPSSTKLINLEGAVKCKEITVEPVLEGHGNNVTFTSNATLACRSITGTQNGSHILSTSCYL